ncbi:MAG: hypothetical protein M1838_001699 [Thelocarpon superellum]|nr:MAG: hypothetical protein M1838_001699 [Thelocarpon superellum]
MAPDRGHADVGIPDEGRELAGEDPAPHGMPPDRRRQVAQMLADRGAQGQNFTWRGVLVGLAVGIIICFSNTYFGLQTGWVSGMAMPASLIGFAFFKSLSAQIELPFTPVENVLVQTVAGAVGTMPLGSGFVGVIPAIEYLLRPSEGGPLPLGLWKLILWSLGLCFFGVVFAVPLRKEVIIREKLKFPSGTATALMIDVLHGSTADGAMKTRDQKTGEPDVGDGERRRLLGEGLDEDAQDDPRSGATVASSPSPVLEGAEDRGGSWRSKIRLLIISFVISGVYTLTTYFIPVLRALPILGLPLARNWLWSLNPSPAYVGQGIIMGPATTLHMLLGAIVGWGILSPLAKTQGWAPGPVKDWTTGSKGWIVWVSLAIMLADSIVSLAWLAFRPLFRAAWPVATRWWQRASDGRSIAGYTMVAGASDPSTSPQPSPPKEEDLPDVDAPPEQLVRNRTVVIGLASSLLFCIVAIQLTFGAIMPLYATIAAVAMALLLSIMGVRALGETDLNPVSGISKLTQLFFALIVPSSNPNAVLINLIAGAVSESGALQAGDMLQDLKTGHLVGASPLAQFQGQLIGSFVGAFASAIIYKLYTKVYAVPGELFQVPTGFVWIFTARLVTGSGLPRMAQEWATGAAAIFALTTALRIAVGGARSPYHAWIPGGIAVAVGMYNVPSFTLARAVGGLITWYWRQYRGRDESPVIVLASGLILGEGVLSIVNLILASLHVPHL